MPRPDPAVAGVRLMSDYMAEWPLWVGNGNFNVTAEHLGLSTALARRLWDWERLFDAHYSHETGWDSESARAEYAAQADVLFRDLRADFVPTWLCLSTCGHSGKLRTPTSMTEVLAAGCLRRPCQRHERALDRTR
jgi:hypothetical protein